MEIKKILKVDYPKGITFNIGNEECFDKTHLSSTLNYRDSCLNWLWQTGLQLKIYN